MNTSKIIGRVALGAIAAIGLYIVYMINWGMPGYDIEGPNWILNETSDEIIVEIQFFDELNNGRILKAKYRTIAKPGVESVISHPDYESLKTRYRYIELISEDDDVIYTYTPKFPHKAQVYRILDDPIRIVEKHSKEN